MYFSQYNEDRILSVIFKNQTSGVCVEVGANDGITYSNTFYFEQIGWKCILVEPTPSLCEKIKDNRKALLFECACSSENGESLFFFVENGDLYSSIEENSTMDLDILKSGLNVSQIRVPIKTLDSILEDAKITNLDFISIDVEGHEKAVLDGFTLNKWNPAIIIIEDNSDLQSTKVEETLSKNKYMKFYRTGGNDWYSKKPLHMLSKIIISNQFSFRSLIKTYIPSAIRKPLILIHRKINHL